MAGRRFDALADISRFDLEQDLINFGCIIDDLKMIAEPMDDSCIDKRRILALAEIYEMKYDKLWYTFEEMVHRKKM